MKVLLSIGLVVLAEGAAAGETVYARSNLHLTGNVISAVNYQTGTMVAVGTAVEVVDRDSDEIELRIGPKAAKFVTHKSLRMKIDDAFDLYFGSDPKPELEKLSKAELAQVRKAKVEIGMTKAAVLLSLGRPPPSKTATTEAPEWFYWKSKMSTFRVVFDDDDKVEIVDDGKKKGGGGFLGGLFSSKSEPKPKDIRYAVANVYTDEGTISWVNYLQGPIIPIGTKVEVTDSGDGSVDFTIVSSGKEYSFENDEDRSGHTAPELFERLFSKEDPAGKISALPKSERGRVKAAKPKVGMTKDAVLMAIGPPPPHATSSLDSDEWTYWKSRFAKMRVIFDDEGKVAEID